MLTGNKCFRQVSQLDTQLTRRRVRQHLLEFLSIAIYVSAFLALRLRLLAACFLYARDISIYLAAKRWSLEDENSGSHGHQNIDVTEPSCSNVGTFHAFSSHEHRNLLQPQTVRICGARSFRFLLQSCNKRPLPPSHSFATGGMTSSGSTFLPGPWNASYSSPCHALSAMIILF